MLRLQRHPPSCAIRSPRPKHCHCVRRPKTTTPAIIGFEGLHRPEDIEAWTEGEPMCTAAVAKMAAVAMWLSGCHLLCSGPQVSWLQPAIQVTGGMQLPGVPVKMPPRHQVAASGTRRTAAAGRDSSVSADRSGCCWKHHDTPRAPQEQLRPWSQQRASQV